MGMDQPMVMGLPPQEGIVNVNVLGMHHVMPDHVHTTAAMTQPVVPGNVWSAVPPHGPAMVPQVMAQPGVAWMPVVDNMQGIVPPMYADESAAPADPKSRRYGGGRRKPRG